MTKLRSKFTKWYYRKGYRMEYRAYDGSEFVAEMIFTCPFYIRPLVYFFFSPCVYYHEVGFEFKED